ncbi:sugar phosphate isomerase/epimerase family protein [Humisphaera borealis]|uniref:Sugar phosphate isomerase/epimerase n=1 Tax=Humisphaera borealis TaxID=2807512 RepID=A0A7M2WVU0_9BACT|nr:sugar phosphate isomerase/epimerase family protein [Humisphaera borealis]QOV89605.1 sugar phosphate isomerase/epimerase [Humisphaera borealis]
MKSAVTISLVSEARGGPFVFWDDLEAGMAKAAALGFDAVEVFAPGPELIAPSVVQPLLAKHNLKLAAVGTGAGWVKHKLRLTSPDAGERSKAIQFVRGIIDAGGPMGAPAIIGSMQGSWGKAGGGDVDKDQALAWLAEALAELSGHAKTQHGVKLIYEPLNRYETNLVNDVASGVKLIQQVSQISAEAGANLTLLADLFHMNIEEADIARAIRAGGHHIGHVHLADSNRRPAGLGHTNFAPIAEALRQIGYTGYISAEAFSYPDADAAAKHTIDVYRSVFA